MNADLVSYEAEYRKGLPVNSTASPRPSATLGQVAKFDRMLHERGVTPDHYQRAIDDPAVMRRVVEAFGVLSEFEAFDLTVEFRQRGVDRLVDELAAPLRVSKRPQLVDYNPYRSSDALKQLFVGLPILQKHVVSLSFGLKDETALSAADVAAKLEIGVQRVHHQRGTAVATMKAVANAIAHQAVMQDAIANPRPPMFPVGVNDPIEDLRIGIRGYNALRHAEIGVIKDLVGLSDEELRIFGFDDEALNDLKVQLAYHGITLNG